MTPIEHQIGKEPESAKEFLKNLLFRTPEQRIMTATAWIHEKSHSQETPYSEGWHSLLRFDAGQDKPILATLLRSLLKDKLIVDLGCGEGRMREVLNSVGVNWLNNYLGIDLHNIPEGSEKSLGAGLAEFSYADRQDGILVKGDMLRFLNHVGDGAIPVIVLNGIDAHIIQDLAYHYILAHEITRVLPIGGIVLVRESQAMDTLLQSGRFEVLYRGFPKTYVLRKTRD